MEINTKPIKLKEQEQKPGLVPFMKDAVEESINKQLDKAWKKDDSAGDVSGAEREPTEVVKMSEADFYVKVGGALLRKRIERKIKS
jgi:hypothetical protein